MSQEDQNTEEATKAENQELRKELAALKTAVAEDNAKARKDINLVKKVLERTRLRVIAEKTLSTTFSAAVRGDIDTVQMLLDRVAQPAPRKPSAP